MGSRSLYFLKISIFIDVVLILFSVDYSPRLGPESESYGQIVIRLNDNANGELVLSPPSPRVAENQSEPFLFVTRYGGAFGEVRNKKFQIPLPYCLQMQQRTSLDHSSSLHNTVVIFVMQE